MSEDCLFCKIASGHLPATIVHEDDRCVAFEDLNPQAPVHVLVVPRAHVSSLNEMDAEDEPLVGHLVAVARDIARERGHAAAGYRVVMNCNAAAGQSVFHIHLHLLAGRQLAWPPG